MKSSEDEKGHNIVEYLIINGAIIDVEDYSGLTPLCNAARANNLPAIKTLTFFGSNVNYVMTGGKFEGGTAMHFAAANSNEETVKLLIELGGDIISKDWRWRLPIHWAAREGLVEVLELLFELCGKDLYLKDNSGLTLLHLAAAGGNAGTTAWLIKHGFQIDIREITGWTPLHSAADSGQVSTIRLLLDHSANINAKTGHRGTPLHLAAFRGQMDAVKELLERGADLNARDQNTWTPLGMAISGRHVEIAELLQTLGGHTGGSSNIRLRKFLN